MMINDIEIGDWVPEPDEDLEVRIAILVRADLPVNLFIIMVDERYFFTAKKDIYHDNTVFWVVKHPLGVRLPENDIMSTPPFKTIGEAFRYITAELKDDLPYIGETLREIADFEFAKTIADCLEDVDFLWSNTHHPFASQVSH